MKRFICLCTLAAAVLVLSACADGLQAVQNTQESAGTAPAIPTPAPLDNGSTPPRVQLQEMGWDDAAIV